MPKYIPYESPTDFLERKLPLIDSIRNFYYKFNKFDDRLSMLHRNPGSSLMSYFMGGFNPLINMKKDFLDTFKPYKSNHYIQKDFLQPVRGIGNVLKGVFHFTVSPVIFFANTLRYAYYGIQNKSFNIFKKNMIMNLAKSGGGLFDGILNFTRGLTQIITTPLTWFLRMPMRGLITLITGKPTLIKNVQKKINPLEELVRKEDKTLDECIEINRGIKYLMTKLSKADNRGQKIGNDFETIIDRLDLCSTFTEEKLSTNGYLKGVFGHAPSKSDYHLRPNDSVYAQEKALNFLDTLKEKSTNSKFTSGITTDYIDENTALLGNTPGGDEILTETTPTPTGEESNSDIRDERNNALYRWNKVAGNSFI